MIYRHSGPRDDDRYPARLVLVDNHCRVANLGQAAKRFLDQGWADHAPVDHCDVHGAAEDVEIAVRIDAAEIARAVPAVLKGCRFQIGAVAVALRHGRRANFDTASLAGNSDRAVVAAEPHLDVGEDAPGGMKTLAVGRVRLGRREDADEALFAGAIGVHDPGPEAPVSAEAKRRRRRRCESTS